MWDVNSLARHTVDLNRSPINKPALPTTLFTCKWNFSDGSMMTPRSRYELITANFRPFTVYFARTVAKLLLLPNLITTHLSVASVGAFSRIFRKLWYTVKTCEGIFSRFGSMVALWVYIKPKTFFPEIFFSSVCRGKMAESAREYPTGHFRAAPGHSRAPARYTLRGQ